MSKKTQATQKLVTQIVKLIVPAGGASPAPPVGPALGSKGVKAIDFAKEFNARTAHLQTGIPIPCVVTVRPDRTFSFETKTPPTSWLLFRSAGIDKGAATPGKEVAGTVSLKHVYEIAKLKATDSRLAGLPLESICKSIIATGKSCGIKTVP